MNQKEISGIVTTMQLEEMHGTDGYYNVRFHGDVIFFYVIGHTYHASGLARQVYISPCRTYVLKIPIERDGSTANDNFQKMGCAYSYSVDHNIAEYLAYHEAPPEYKELIAKTELITELAWIKQEFVEVRKAIGFDLLLREVGVTIKGDYVLFDLDLLMDCGYQKPIKGFDYPYLKRCIEYAKKINSL